MGRVTQSVTRWEVQGRGSLHTHVLLWIHPDDVERIADLLSAAMPADWDPEKGEKGDWVEPEDEHERRLFHMIKEKMQHKCR